MKRGILRSEIDSRTAVVVGLSVCFDIADRHDEREQALLHAIDNGEPIEAAWNYWEEKERCLVRALHGQE